MRRGLIIVAAAVCMLAGGASSATANEQLESVFQDDDLLIHQPPEKVDASMAQLKALGVDRIRVSAIWRERAPLLEPSDPTDPDSYDDARLQPLDTTIRSAARHGVLVLLNVRGGVPEWAQPRRPAGLREEDAYKPNRRKFQQYTEMLGRRYSGTYTTKSDVELPRVTAWSIWNEPNWPSLLQPQSTESGKPFSPHLYRELFRAASRGLRATGHGDDIILLGETAPLGVSEPGSLRSMKAALFYRTLFCLTEDLKPEPGCGDFDERGPLLADGVAHHPYPVLAPPEFRSPDKGYIRLGDSERLFRILDAAERYGRLPGTLPVWYTEYGYQTKPPDPYRGISLNKQAAWNVRAERLAFSEKRVVALTQFLLNDSGPRTQYAASHPNYWSNYQTGLRYFEGGRKPAFYSYRLPFLRLSQRKFWGMVRPAPNGIAQVIRIEERRSGAWESVGTRTVTNAKGYFTLDVPFAGRGKYRFVWNELASRPAVPAPR
ncbi:MAG: hypothetical protein WKF94_10030 [Solirubrobacteraceae bacterium]